ncbi:hypothetical protein FS837_004762 [Tulasnella sp. UAMH 9824]|nr:hypothetical protein FS837_004762 [Tulasnella sp. UAMH 9824]
MFDIEYRLWLLRRLSILFLPPLAAVYTALRLVEYSPNPFIPKTLLARTACYILSLPFYWAAWIQLSNWDNERRARKLGARLPPLIQSKRFGGLDLRERLINGISNDYVGVVFDEMLDEVGADTARLSILWSERVITRDPDVLKFFVSTGFPHFGRGELAQIRLRGLLGRGIFASDGERAKMHRALARPYFARERVSDYNTFQRHSAKVCDILIDHAKQSRPCDVQDLFARFTMDTAGEFLFGRDDFGTLDMPLPQPGAEMSEGAKSASVEGGYGSFVNAFESAQVLITKRLAMGPYGWAMAEFFNDSVKKHMRVVDSYLEPLVSDAVQRRKNLKPEEKGEKHEYESFLDHLVDSTSDVQLIKDQLLNILLAARDTTAQLLSWTCYVLALHPDVMDRLRQEVLATYGESEEPTFETVKTLKYLRAVLDEVLRLFPPVPVNGRSPFNDPTVVPTRQGPFYFPSAGMLCNWSVISMHKHKDLWGEDADTFDPDRWIDPARARRVVENPFMFLPFNGGPRICIGQQFAYNEASFVMVRLMQLFDRFTLAQKEAAPASALPSAAWKNSAGRKRIEEAWPKVMVDLTYRIWLIKSLARLFVPPLVSVALALRVLGRAKSVHLHPAYQIALYLLSLPVYWTSWIKLTRWDENRRAKKHGAKLPPIIEGKKLGNFDGFTEDYVGTIIDELLDEAGVDTARLSLLWSDRLITRDHDVMKYILSTGFNDFEKGPQSIMRFGSFLGTGIFASDGDRAKSHRAIARPYFARERISDYECFSRHTEKLLAIIQDHSSSDTPLDVQDIFARFTMDAAEEFLFGNHDFATLDLPLPKPGQTEEGAKGSVLEGVFGRFVQAFEQGQTNAVNRLGKGNYGWTITEFFSDKQMPIVKTMEEYLEPLAAAAIKRKKEREAKGEVESKEHESFLDHLVASTDDLVLIKDQLRNILLAARDTVSITNAVFSNSISCDMYTLGLKTAQLLSFTCYCLALKPEILDRLRQEILSAYGDSTIPTYDDLKKQKYLRAVLDETLRLFPPVPVNVRHSKHDVVIPTREGGLYIPRGDFTCIYSTVSIQRRKDLWGDDAEEYNPERWIDPERARKIASDPFMFLPFNGGPRICLGQVSYLPSPSPPLDTNVLFFLMKQFAYNEASFVLVRILQKFSRITLAQDEAAPASALPPASWKEAKGRKRIEKVWPKTALTLYSKGGMWMRLHQ